MTIRYMLLLLLIFLFCGAGDLRADPGSEISGQVWQVGQRRWDVAEERRFAAWVEKTVTDDFFIRHNIPVDCADVPYAIRWIYARIAHLPAAATADDGRLIGQWSTAWAHLPVSQDWSRDQRFRAALLHMLTETSTRTLPADTYPIRISPDAVMAGSVFIGDGHAGLIGRIVLDGSTFSPIQTWEATLPRKITKLRQGSYFAAWPDSTTGTGLVRFRWPEYADGRWSYPAKEQQPFYSMEQYSPGFWHTGELFDEEVAHRIDPKEYDPAVRVRLIAGTIYRYLLERVPLVKEGYRHCRKGNCTEGSSLWEAYSTPGRDDMIAFEIEHLVKIITENRLNTAAINTMMDGMTIPVAAGWTVSLSYVVQNYPWMSHDPGDSLEARWGLNKCEMIRNRMRGSIQALDFVEQRYRVADPAYADTGRSIRMADLERLQAEGKKAGCENLPPLPVTISPPPSRMPPVATPSGQLRIKR